MKTFRTKYPFVITKGQTLRKQAECKTLTDALQTGCELCNKSKSPYFQVWYRVGEKWRCDFMSAKWFTI